MVKLHVSFYQRYKNSMPSTGMRRFKKKEESIRNILWDIPSARESFEGRGLKETTADAGDLIDAIVSELGLTRSLRVVGVRRDRFDELARLSLNDPWLVTNPVPVMRNEQVMEILEMCA